MTSGYEVERTIFAGVSPGRIPLTLQLVPNNPGDLVEMQILYNACSGDILTHEAGNPGD